MSMRLRFPRPARGAWRLLILGAVGTVAVLMVIASNTPAGQVGSGVRSANQAVTHTPDASPSTAYWGPIYSNSPSPAWSSSGGGPTWRFVYDAAAGYDVLLKAPTARGAPDETWTFSDGSWVNITATAGIEPPVGDMVYNPTSHAIDLYTSNGTWSFAGAAWSFSATGALPQPNGNSGTWFSLAYDLANNYMVLFGGSVNYDCCGIPAVATNDTWILQSGSWTNITPTLSLSPPATTAGETYMTYDPMLGAVLLTGPGTWEFENGSWTNLNSGGSPPQEFYAQLAYYPSSEVTIWQSGQSTWEYGAGGWDQLTPELEPAPPFEMFYGAMAAGSGFGGPVLAEPTCAPGCEGGNNGTYQLWQFDLGSLPPAPSVTSFTASSFLLTLGSTVTLTVSTAGGLGALTYSYLGLPTGCSSSNASSLTCLPRASGSYLLTVTVTDLVNRSASASYTLTVVSTLEWLGIGGAVAAAVLFSAFLIVRRRRRVQPVNNLPSPAGPTERH
jgi:hypothetical protein